MCSFDRHNLYYVCHHCDCPVHEDSVLFGPQGKKYCQSCGALFTGDCGSCGEEMDYTKPCLFCGWEHKKLRETTLAENC